MSEDEIAKTMMSFFRATPPTPQGPSSASIDENGVVSIFDANGNLRMQMSKSQYESLLEDIALGEMAKEAEKDEDLEFTPSTE